MSMLSEPEVRNVPALFPIPTLREPVVRLIP